MKVLVACEYTGTVRDAFLRRGHDAWSCDMIRSPLDKGPHIQRNVLELDLASYDLVIGHPPCTYLTNLRATGRGGGYPEPQTTQAVEFFLALLYCGAPRVAIENPRNIIKKRGGPKWTQLVQPYEFGDGYTKLTALWLLNLPKLRPTKIVEPISIMVGNGFQSAYRSRPAMVPGYTQKNGETIRWPGMYDNAGSATGHLRSIFSRGMAEAMADQWGSLPQIESRWPRVHRDVYAFEALA